MRTFIVAAKRTPFGAFGGKLAKFTATQLGAHASRAALQSLPAATKIDSVIFGNVLQTSTCAPYLARHVALRAGLPHSVPAITINRLCGSGFQTVISAIHEISANDAKIVLTGGAESMSQAPYAVRDVRWGTKYGSDIKMEDTLAATLIDQYPGSNEPTPMGITGEKLGEMYGITRQMCDEYALASQMRHKAASDAGWFANEISPMEVKVKRTTETFDKDEHPRPQSTIESMTKLPSVFVKDGLVTAGNASGICDGAAAVIVASQEAVDSYKLEPLAEIVAYHVSGVDPKIMGIGPVPAIKGALKKANKTLEEMDIVEVNEAFAAQYLAVEKDLGLPREITNQNGGAIAVGHPLAASGSRILTHIAWELNRQQKQYGIGAACIGGGQGIAVILKRL